jgi:hypothetical protein
LATFDSNLMTGSVLSCWHAYDMSIANVEFRAVSRTDQAIAIEFTVAKCAAIVRAKVFDAIDLGIVPDEHNITIEYLHGLGFSDLKFIEIACELEVVADDRFPYSFTWSR